MKTKRRKYCGWMIAELIVAMGVLGMILVCFSVSLGGFSRLNHYHLARQRCISAAQATLDSIAATGEPISVEDANRLWPGIGIEVNETAGQGQWNGMTLLTVKANCPAVSRQVNVQLSRYIRPAGIRERRAIEGDK
jgi:type II secretory pathway pseudopilin PulG